MCYIKYIKKFISLFICLTVINTTIFADVNYTKYADDIKQRLNKAYELYISGDSETAKQVIQSSYFEVFENLEGPIRINISSKKSYLMESQFTDMRKMITKDVSQKELRASIDSFIEELNEVIPEITGGHVLVAESGNKVNETSIQKEKVTKERISKILPTWRNAIDMIAQSLNEALEKYDPENSKETRSLIQHAQFEGYRNSGIETAIKKYNSSEKEANIQKQFTDMIRFVHKKPSKEELNKKIIALNADILEVAPELGLVKNAKKIEVKQKEEVKKDYSIIRDEIYKIFNKAITISESKNKEAIMMIQNSYFDIFEASGMESAIGAKDATLKADIESSFGKIIALIKNNSSKTAIQNEYKNMKNLFDNALNLLSDSKSGFMAMFIYSLTIILREGFEALLIVTAIVTYLIKSGNEDRLNIVYSSLSLAIVLSFATAYLMNVVFGTAAAENRELLEGIVMLVASGLLLYVAYWLISNASAKRWTNYIKDQVQNSLDKNSVKALWFTVFFAVYREGAETVLFYQALIVDARNNAEYSGLIAGFFVSIFILIIIYILMKYTAIKLPIKPFFIATGTFIYVMTFIFMGKGIMELVEGKIFIPTPIESMPTIITIGIFPYWQTIIPQLLILLLGVWGLIKIRQQNNSLKERTENI